MGDYMEKYVFDSEDNKLYSDLLLITNKIIEVYKLFSLNEKQNNYLNYDDLKTKLAELIHQENDLYKKIFEKGDRVKAFYFLTCKKGDLDSYKDNDYKNFMYIISDKNQCYKRIRSMLSLEYDYLLMNDEVDYLSQHANIVSNVPVILPPEFLKQMIRKNIIGNYRLSRFYYLDIFSSFLVYLEDEINNSINYNIKDSLIDIKYNIISSNVLVEDKFIKNEYKICDEYYKTINIVCELHNISNESKKKINQLLFKNAINNCTNQALILGDRPFDSNNYKDILLDVIMIESILAITDDDNLFNEMSDIMQNFQNKIKSNNIANFLLKDLSNNNNNYNYKIINMSLRQN